MTFISGSNLSGLYGISSGLGTYGDANVIALFTNYQYPIYVNNSITATGNVSGNIIVGNAWYYGNGVNLITSLYSNANAQAYLPTHSGLLGGTLNANSQPNITAVGPLVNLTVSSNVNAAGYAINNLGIPVAASDAANKQYVDSIAQGLNVKAAVSVATTTGLQGYVYYNGPANNGVGATLTGLSLGLLTIDGTTVTVGSRVLVKNETSANSPYNGIYLCVRNNVGSTYQLQRTTDFDMPANIYGSYCYVIGGSSLAGTNWVNTNICTYPITIGTTAITFVQFGAAGSYTGGTGIAINTGVINALVDNSTIQINGNNQIFATGYLPSANIGSIVTGNIQSNGTINSANITTGNILANSIITNSINSNTVAFGGNISVSGNITAANFYGSGANLTGLYGNSNVIAFMPTYSGNITSVNSVQAVNNVGGNNINAINGVTANYVMANVASVAGNVYSGQYFLGNGAYLTGISGSNYSNANVASYLLTNTANIAAGNISVTGNITSTYLFGNGAFLTGIGGATGSPGGPLNSIQYNAGGGIFGGTANLVFDGANLSVSGNVSATYFKGIATSAEYADLAEMYAGDQRYDPGTVVEIGGIADITQTSSIQSTRVIGVISTQPSFLMNTRLDSDSRVAVALTGRVPCRVIGTIRRGDLLVSSNVAGVATACENPALGSVIGKAMDEYDSITEGVIEIIVGKV
jgi:hypothetical protein